MMDLIQYRFDASLKKINNTQENSYGLKFSK